MTLRALLSFPIVILALAGLILSPLPGFVLSPDQESALYSHLPLLRLGAISATALTLWTGFLFLYARRESTALRQLMHRLPENLRARIHDDDPIPLDGAQRNDAIGAVFRKLDALAETTRKAVIAKSELEKMALTDSLTGLPNQRALLAFVQRVAGHERGWSDPGQIGILHVDLDHFKVINDTLGHDAGDFVLKEASLRMADAVRDSDLIARVGGDEFVIVAPRIADTDALESMIGRLIGKFDAPIEYGDVFCKVGVSIGAVVSGSDSVVVDANQLMADADLALNNAKAQGRGGFAMFSTSMRKESQDKKKRAMEIRDGLLAEEFRPWFQPVVDIRTRQATSVEVLARWHRAGHGVLPPGAFLGAAEFTNLLEEIGYQVLEGACRTIRKWRAIGHEIPNIHVNMSRSQLLAPGAVDKLSWILDDTNTAPEGIAIELSEKYCIGRSSEVIFENLRQFRMLGLHTTLDDFAINSGSIRNITRLDCTTVKCAQSLISALAGDPERPEDLQILGGLPGIGRTLGVGFVAKGVEHEDQLTQLADFGFEEIQGNLTGPPMDADSFIAWIGDRKAQTLLAG